MEENKTMSDITVPKSQIVKLAKSIEHLDDTAPVTFEYVLSCCFPTVWDNICQIMRNNYTKGYIDGISSNKN